MSSLERTYRRRSLRDQQKGRLLPVEITLKSRGPRHPDYYLPENIFVRSAARHRRRAEQAEARRVKAQRKFDRNTRTLSEGIIIPPPSGHKAQQSSD